MHAWTWHCCQVDPYSVTNCRSLPPLSDTVFFSSIIAIFSQYFSSIKLVKNVRNFLLSLPWECVCWYFLYNRNAVLYDFTTKIVYLWHGSTWQHCHARACVFSVFKALLIMNKYLYCAQTEQAPNSDSKTHVVNLNQTSRTDLSRYRYLTFFLGHPVEKLILHADNVLYFIKGKLCKS